MLTASQRVHVDAPVEAVFAFMDDPSNQPVVSPSVTGVRNVEPLPDGGKRLEYTYRAFGVPLRGELETTTYEPDRRVVFELRGAITGEIEWTFEPSGTGTWFEYRARYEFPLPGPVARLLAPLLRWYNARELRRTAANLREQVPARRNS